MAERPVPEAIASIDLASIADVGARQAIRALLNLVEEQASEIRALRIENQQLRDELTRLKGGQGRPKIPPGKSTGGSTDYSSEQERRPAPKPWQKRGKQDRLRIDRTERVAVDRARRPAGYDGTFGPHLRTLVVTLAYGGGMSERKILELVEGTGIVISAGTVSNLLTEGRAAFETEAREVLKAGLASSPYQHIDDTSTRVAGEGQYCQIVCNPLYTAYQTTPKKDRQTIIEVLRGGRPRAYRFDQEADRHLAWLKLSAAARTKLTVIPREQPLDEATLTALLDGPARGLGPKQQEQVREALALAAYLADPAWPVVRTLVCDDAPQFRAITEELALCWIHEGRHFKQLTPYLPQHRAALADILTQFWDYYRELLAYREHPTPEDRARLDTAFDTLFSTTTGYQALDHRLALTLDKKPELLQIGRASCRERV